MRKVILLTGPARSGKDTVATMLRQAAQFRPVALAAPIRAMLQAGGLLSFDDLRRKEEPLPLHGRSPRRLMQTLGTDWGRNLVGIDLWVRLLIAKITRELSPDAPVVVTDVRFPNEVEVLTAELGAIVWHIDRPVWQIDRPGRICVEDHVSEAGVRFEVGHLRISNDSSLPVLRARVLAALHESFA